MKSVFAAATLKSKRLTKCRRSEGCSKSRMNSTATRHLRHCQFWVLTPYCDLQTAVIRRVGAMRDATLIKSSRVARVPTREALRVDESHIISSIYERENVQTYTESTVVSRRGGKTVKNTPTRNSKESRDTHVEANGNSSQDKPVLDVSQ